MQRAEKKVNKVPNYPSVCGHKEQDINTSSAGILSYTWEFTVNNKLSEMCLCLDPSCEQKKCHVCKDVTLLFSLDQLTKGEELSDIICFITATE